jgi:hypothetical protein
MPTIAARMAAASLAPSPIIAQTWPRRCRVCTIWTLCSGDIRTNTNRSATACSWPRRGRASRSAPLITRTADLPLGQRGEHTSGLRPGCVREAQESNDLESVTAEPRGQLSARPTSAAPRPAALAAMDATPWASTANAS